MADRRVPAAAQRELFGHGQQEARPQKPTKKMNHKEDSMPPRPNPGKMLSVLTDEGPRGRRLRQSSPFPGVLTPRERQAIFDRYESIAA